MKWDALDKNFDHDTLNNIRHRYGYKCVSWDGVKENYSNVVHVSQQTYDLLFEDETIGTPMDDLPDHLADSIFITRLADGRKFLVNTEGYGYCRYITRVVVDPNM